MGSLSKAMRGSDDWPKWPQVLKEALGHNLGYPGYVVRLQDGSTVHAESVNKKHVGMATLYRGYVENTKGTRVRDLKYRGEDFPLSSVADAWKEPR